ncbi:MAG: hypothetical protein WAV95_04805 [Azonexus sp.]
MITLTRGALGGSEFVEPDTPAGIRLARTAWETTGLPKKLARYHLV